MPLYQSILAEARIGPQGAQGTQGFQGAQGFQGNQGTDGIQGVQGFQGTIGSQGNVGGPQGVQGAEGIQGAQGIQGITGSRVYSVTNSGASSYLIDSASNPTLNLLRGFTYTFNVNATGHPFWIQTVSGGYSSGNIYNTGVTNNGTASGVLIFAIPYNAPNTLYYYCQFHSSMGGTINISDIGPIGTQGFQGSQGLIGSQGSQGIQGVQGFQGAQGFQGEGGQGPQGFIRLPRQSRYRWYSRCTGIPGSIRSQGGPVGPQGLLGSQGN